MRAAQLFERVDPIAIAMQPTKPYTMPELVGGVCNALTQMVDWTVEIAITDPFGTRTCDTAFPFPATEPSSCGGEYRHSPYSTVAHTRKRPP